MPQTPSGPLPGTATKQVTVGRNELSEALTAAGAAERIEDAVEEGGDLAGGGYVIFVQATDEARNEGEAAKSKAVVGTD